MDKKKMWDRAQKPAFYLGILGALKLCSEAFGVQIITEEQINAIANGLAALATVIGVVVSYD